MAFVLKMLFRQPNPPTVTFSALQKGDIMADLFGTDYILIEFSFVQDRVILFTIRHSLYEIPNGLRQHLGRMSVAIAFRVVIVECDRG